jgi:hypothetical protein
MDQDIKIKTEKIHEILADTFEALDKKPEIDEVTAVEKEENNNSRIPDGEQSIFDSTSEYIITGNELTGKTITVSTHDVHIMTVRII